MHRMLVLAIAVVLAVLPTGTFAQSGNVRILLHGTKSLSENGFFGWDAWVVAPNVANVPSKWLVVTGPRLSTTRWWSEFNVGAFVHDGETTPTIDIRTNWPSPKPFSFWTNVQWTDFSDVYAYGEVNYKLPGGFMVGIESENVLPEKSIGPHLYIPLGEAVLQAIYQFHEGEDELWFRFVINFR